MPRVDYSRGAGRRVPGVYAAMLEKERERHDRYGEAVVLGGREQRVVWADPDDHSAGVFRRDDKLLKLLEAGKPVIVQRWWVGSRKSKLSVHWPYERGTVKFVQVNPDDTITPARDLDPHVGRVAEGY
ncbi:MAG: hypothetical protein QOH91_1616 [Mycobacterium sp.]|jgi:hypothetical protein|nr:hypothetical protein [Mycobacterium sp.]